MTFDEMDLRYVRQHQDAIERLPDWVRQCWFEYSSNINRYPFGFSYHFPEAWNWKNVVTVPSSPEPLSAGGATSTGASPRAEPAVDEVDQDEQGEFEFDPDDDPSIPPWE